MDKMGLPKVSKILPMPPVKPMKEDGKLDECPFCGNKDIGTCTADNISKWCHECDCRGPEAKTEKKAADKWNKRFKKNF